MNDHNDSLTNMTGEQRRAILAEMLKSKGRQQQTIASISDGQRAMWFLNQAAPESAAYHVAFSARICSPLDPAQLQKAVQVVINRHASLRTTYAFEGDLPAQVVHGYQDAEFHHFDASSWDEDELYRQVMQAYSTPFSLEAGPVMRAFCFTRAADEHVFLLVAHHIAVDAHSWWVILEDLRRVLELQAANQPVTLAAEPPAYAEWARWQAQMLESKEGANHLEFWKQQLAGEMPALNLPYDFPHPAVQTFHGDSISFTLDTEQTRQLRALARSQGVTLYMLMLASYQVLLQRYTGQDAFYIGTPTSGREQERFQNTVGYFVNPVVMRADLSDSPTFAELLRKTRQTVLGALEHQEYPFIRLVRELAVRQDPSRSPVFQTVFNLISADPTQPITRLLNQTGQNSAVTFGGLQVQPYHIAQQEGQFELVLEMIDVGEILRCTLHYNTDLFQRETIERMRQSFCVLLEQILAGPETPLHRLQVLSADERHKMLIEWNATDISFPCSTFLHQLFEQQVERAPHATAVIFGDTILTYAQLNARANQLANYLHSLGAQVGHLVGICMERSPEMIVSILGVLKSGAAYVPVDPAYPPERIAWVIEDSGMNLMLLHEATCDRLPESSIRQVNIDADWNRISYEDSANLPMTGSTEALAYVIYTSGSTGKPKGAMIPHRGIVSQITWMQHAFPTVADDVVMQKASFSFDASIWEAHVPLANGGTLLLADPGGEQDGMYMVDAIQQHRVTKMLMVPSVLQLLVETPGFENCTSLRTLFVGGEALSMALVRDLRAVNPVQLVNLYGPTETTIDTIYWVCDPDYPGKMAILGQPVGNTRAYALDAHLQPVPVGVAGELHTGGAQVGRGYLNRPELTTERFINDPFDPDPDARLYKTGDLVRYRPDGLLEYLGRNDSQVKIRGFRIELGEIEAVLSQHPAVQGAVVTVREDSGGEKRLAAYIVPREGQAPAVRDLRAYLKDRLPAYMLPSNFVILEEFPVTASGKVDRRALPAPERGSADAQRVLQPPVTETEQNLAQIWKDLLKLEQVNLFDNFFDLGGHSLLAMRLVARTQQAFGQRLDPALLRFENLGQIAARMDALQAQATGTKTV